MGEGTGFRHTEGGPAAWQGQAFPSGYPDLSSRTRTAGDTVFYAACELQAEKTGTYSLAFLCWSRGAVWLDGKQVLAVEANPLALGMPRADVEVKLEKGRIHRVLVKLLSRNRQAIFRLALTQPGEGPEPVAAPFRVVLRVPEERGPELLAQALAVGAGADGLLRADEQVPMHLHAPFGGPMLDGELTVRTMLTDRRGRLVRAFDPVTVKARSLLTRPLPLAWVVPRDATEPRYVARVELRFGGKAVGQLRREFYLAEGLTQWVQSLDRKLRETGKKLGRRQPAVPDYAFARLKLEKAGLMGRAYEPMAGIVEELEACEAALQRMDQLAPRPVQPGLAEYAYLSTVDDSAQPYFVFVPRAHDGKTPRPCIVYLHGYSPDLNKLNWQQLSDELLRQADRHGFYIAAPFARSNTDFQSIGEADVIEVLERVSRDVPVDPDRVYLMGYSMGGMGAFTLGAHFPDRWAGILSVAGRADYYLWKQLDPAKVEPWKRRLLDLEFGAAAMGNFRNTPLLMYHGSADSLVRPEQSRRMHQALQAMGADVTLRILPDEDHWIMSRVMETDAIFQWMNRPRRRNRWPTEIDFTSYSIRYQRSHWVTVNDLVRWGEPIRVRARLDADRSRLDIRTENVASLSLNLDEQLVGKAPKLTVRINGREHPVAKPGAADFEVVPVKPVGKLRKTPTLCGPVKEAFVGRFLLVFGVGKGDRALEQLRADLGLYAGEWYRFTKSMPLWERADQVTEEQIASSNLVLHGSPSDNPLLRRIADKLPIKITDRGFEFQGKTYDRADHGLVMIYPNPLNPERYVVVRSGLPYGERLPENHKYDLLPDFIIFRRGVDYDDTDTAAVAGFFDENWQVAERLLWRRAPDAPAPDPSLPRAEPPAWPEPFQN